MTEAWHEEFDPTGVARSVLRWAQEFGATTLGEAYDMLDQLEVSNDVPEVLGHDGTVDEVREEFLFAIDTVGPDAELTTLL